MLQAFTMSLALSAVAVPPGEQVENHGGPTKYTQPTVRRNERRTVDQARRLSWEGYCRELDRLWVDYRAAGSTAEAFETYKASAREAKRRYVYGDPYLLPIETVSP